MIPMSTMTPEQLEYILESAIMSAGQPLSILQMQKLFPENEVPTTQEVRTVLQNLEQRYSDRGIQLKEVSSGYQFQSRTDFSPWLSKLWEERPPRYSRAFLETLAIIAYRQPVTRAEIEDIRGVGVSSSIFKTLLEREWIRLVGYKDVPGKPAIYGTTKAFLDYFNLKSLRELPELIEAQAAALENNQPLQLAFDNTLQAAQAVAEQQLALAENNETVALESETQIEAEFTEEESVAVN